MVEFIVRHNDRETHNQFVYSGIPPRIHREGIAMDSTGLSETFEKLDTVNATPYREKIRRIEPEDLKFVEKDLKYYEKVSMAFLLFGNQTHNILYVLQKLMTLYNSQDDESEILYDYARIIPDDEWKVAIVEALAIIQANKVLTKLGFRLDEVRERLLPHIPEIGTNIHPILKTLYKVCEELTPAEAGKLLQATNSESTIRFYDEAYLEIYILDWITKGMIRIGNVEEKIAPDLDRLIEYLKFNDYTGLYDRILCAINKFNENFRLRSRNVNDSVLAGPSSDVSRSKSFDRKKSIDLCEADLSYRIGRETAGYLLIINQMNFTREKKPELQHLLPKNNLEQRLGSEADEQSLKNTFKAIGYKAVVKKDLIHHEIIPTVKDFVSRSIAYDSLIVCILSHGAEGVIYGSNSIPVEIRKVKELLSADSLLNKPKILLIQACQGNDLQEAKPVESNLERDGPGDSAASLADMLVVISTVPGFASIRHKVEGSWFIQSLCKQINKHGERHIADILTIVFQEVQSKRTGDNECMVPILSSTLKKYLYLPKIL